MPGKGRVVILYNESDGLAWAQFLQAKLLEKQYSINTDIWEASHEEFQIQPSHDLVIVLCTPDFVEEKDQTSLNICQDQVQILVLLGTQEVGIQHLPVDLGRVNVYVPEQKEESVRKLLLLIIQAFEKRFCGDEIYDSYARLPPRRQVNAVKRVIPLPQSEEADDRSYLLMMVRPTDGQLTVHSNQPDGAEMVLPTALQKHAFYLLDIPKNVNLETMTVKCGSQSFCEYDFNTKQKRTTVVSYSSDSLCSIDEYDANDEEVSSTMSQYSRSSEVPTNRASTPYEEIDDVNEDKSFNSEENSGVSGTCSVDPLDKLSACLKECFDPVKQLCCALHLSSASKEDLDMALVNMCNDLEVLKALGDGLTKTDETIQPTNSEMPNLLHLSAILDLPKLAEKMLQIPVVQAQYYELNRKGENPLDVANSCNSQHAREVFLRHEEQLLKVKGNNNPCNKDSGLFDCSTEDEVGSGHILLGRDEGSSGSNTEESDDVFPLPTSSKLPLKLSLSAKPYIYSNAWPKTEASITSPEAQASSIVSKKPPAERENVLSRSVSDRRHEAYSLVKMEDIYPAPRRNSEPNTSTNITYNKQGPDKRGRLMSVFSRVFHKPRKSSLPDSLITSVQETAIEHNLNPDDEHGFQKNKQSPTLQTKHRKGKKGDKFKEKRRQSIREKRVLSDTKLSAIEIPSVKTSQLQV